MFKKSCLSLVFAAAVSAVPLTAGAVDVKLEVVAEGLTHPMTMVSPPGDDRKFIVEQTGTIKILGADGKLMDGDFLNIKHKLPPLKWEFDEEGLLGLAFPPDFKKSGKFYIAYTAQLRGDADLGKQLWYAHTNVVAEYRVSKDDPNKADQNYERIVHAIDWPQFNHNGHWIAFGPDGMLYISTGDGGYANDWGIGHNVTIGNGQDNMALLGKILRIDVKGEPYTVPKDNPFVGNKQLRPGDLGDGLPQSVALLVRHGRQQGPLLRRRGPEQLRGSGHRQEGRQLRLARDGRFALLRLRQPQHPSGELQQGGHDRSDHRVQELLEPGLRREG